MTRGDQIDFTSKEEREEYIAEIRPGWILPMLWLSIKMAWIKTCNVCLRASRIGGNGLFALRSYSRGEFICGVAMRGYQNDGAFGREPGERIDKVLARYNSRRHIAKTINTKTVCFQGLWWSAEFIVARKSISKGEELTRYYSETFWIDHFIRDDSERERAVELFFESKNPLIRKEAELFEAQAAMEIVVYGGNPPERPGMTEQAAMIRKKAIERCRDMARDCGVPKTTKKRL